MFLLTTQYSFSAQQHICYSGLYAIPVRLSIRPSHGWISCLKLGSCNFHHRVAPWI